MGGWDIFKAEVDEVAAQSIAGNLPWYAQQVKNWQYGFGLIFNSTTYRYYYADTTTDIAVAARLVSKVSVIEVRNINFNGVVIKVAKNNGGVLVPLDNTPGSELESLTTYVNRVKFAGIQTSVISIASDKVKLTLNIYYDGTLVLADFKLVVEQALKDYLTNIEFDGILYLNELTDALQVVPGAREPFVFITSCQCKADADIAYTSVLERYSPASGYFQLVPVGNTLADTQITYIAV